MKVSVESRVGGFWTPGILKLKVVPEGYRVAVLNPFLTIICLRVVSTVTVGVVGNIVNPEH